MENPIILYESGDIALFENAAIAENYLEPIGIENNLYELFDSQGNALIANVEGIEFPFFYNKHIKITSSSYKDINRLNSLLSDFIQRYSDEDLPPSPNLQYLMEKIETLVDYTE